jgi:hypothetical protein
MGLSDDEDFVFHALRHTRATRLVQHGVNLRVIQQFMGHKAIQTTLRYAHVSDDMLASAVDKIQLLETVGEAKVPPGDRHETAGEPRRRGAVLEPVQ